MPLAFGILCGVVEAARSGRRWVDAAMVDGAALLAGMMHGLRADGQWGERGTNLLDGGAWFYEVYETADGRYVSLGAIDARSCAELVRLTGLADDVDGGGPVPDPADWSSWPAMKVRMAALDADEDARRVGARLEGTDACFAPVLDPAEAPEAPPPAGARTFTEVGGVVQPAPAPRFSRTAPALGASPPAPGAHTAEALATGARPRRSPRCAAGERCASASAPVVVSKHSCTSGSDCSSPTSTGVSRTPRSTSSSSASGPAEQVGFDSVWVSEHHFSDYQLTSQQSMVLSWLAGRTSRLAGHRP